ncbi:hypothetical protein GC173_15160 [bacterium]|nr:hypothetical protein [bacterium]
MSGGDESPIEELDRLYAEGDLRLAIQRGEMHAEAHPDDVELRQRVGLLLVEASQHDPAPDLLFRAVSHLNAVLIREPSRLSCLEVRANVFNLLAFRTSDDESTASAFYGAASADFQKLIASTDPAHDDREEWHIEAARSSFLSMRHGDPAVADYRVATSYYAAANQESLLPADWFFRGLAHRELAGRSDDPAERRVAAACFLRAIEAESYPVEGRYFAADELLQLETPTDDEFAQASLLVDELDALSAQDGFLLKALKHRLQLRADLLGKGSTPTGDEKDDA